MTINEDIRKVQRSLAGRLAGVDKDDYSWTASHFPARADLADYAPSPAVRQLMAVVSGMVAPKTGGTYCDWCGWRDPGMRHSPDCFVSACFRAAILDPQGVAGPWFGFWCDVCKVPGEILGRHQHPPTTLMEERSDEQPG